MSETLHTACRVREGPPGRDLLAVHAALRARPCPWLLDGALPASPLGRWSFAGADPWAVLRAWGGRVELDVRRAVRPDLAPGRRVLFGDPLEVARSLLRPAAPAGAPDAALPPFAGGAVGCLGYELAGGLEPALALRAADDLGLPDLTLLLCDRVLAFDGHSGHSFACGLGFGGSEGEARAAAERAAGAAAEDLRPEPAALAPPPPAAAREVVAAFDAASYGKAVERIRERITAGDVYQACLTHRLECACEDDPFDLYRRLRAANPAPFAALLELPDAAVVSSSPERFLRVSPDGRVESRPIKGTRPRGAGRGDDARLRAALADSPKERAENLMIVDLVRNDLGRVCETGSVHVPELMAIEAHAAVFQMVSTVAGRLARGQDALDAVRAAFPPGSMTGAPKIAAMRLLDRLEPVRRGIYSGALGWLDARGGCDLSVVIRTLVCARGRAWVHAGGGIVADSDPADEWRETLHKARPLLRALGARLPA